MALVKKNIAQLIKYIDERNSEGKVSAFYGINIHKEFMPTVANTKEVNARNYKIIRNGRFVFSGMQTGRDECIRIGLYNGKEPGLVSPAYTTFEIKNSKIILPEYFFMLFLRGEMDRYGWFISDSSVRANLDLDRFEEIIFKLPRLDIQQKYVDIFMALTRVAQLKTQIKNICSTLIQCSLRDISA